MKKNQTTSVKLPLFYGYKLITKMILKVRSAWGSSLSIMLYLLLSACGNEADTPVIRADARPNIIIILTDDQGYADVGAQGEVKDISTPHLDHLAATGVRMTSAYSPAPQCTPARAALLAGSYHQRFGLDDNTFAPFPLKQATLAEKLAANGYQTGMVGKWHLGVNRLSEHWYQEVYAPGAQDKYDFNTIPESVRARYYPENRGFQDVFNGYYSRFRANFDLDGNSTKLKTIIDERFRLEVTSDAAVSFVRRHKDKPFFLYVPYFAPHVPLEANEKYLSRFQEKMPERRRYALAMLSAIDDGVGRIVGELEKYALEEDTLIIFMSDNGAPLALDKEDVMPVSTNGPEWDGSLNDPWLGEKGMLSEGAIRVPFIMNWKGHLPEGLVYEAPVMSFDATVTAAALAEVDSSTMDGINLVPYLNSPKDTPDRSLYWRFRNQAAVRNGKWKYLMTGNEGEYLFDLSGDQHEKQNMIDKYPGIAADLSQQLGSWAATLKRPGLPGAPLSGEEKKFYQFHFSDIKSAHHH